MILDQVNTSKYLPILKNSVILLIVIGMKAFMKLKLCACSIFHIKHITIWRYGMKIQISVCK